jgi:hypothetical protein
MKRVILTIAIVLCAASAFADDHRGDRGESDNGHHYGHYRKHDSHRKYECREVRIWQPRYVTYRPESRATEPHLAISIHTPELILSFLTGR